MDPIQNNGAGGAQGTEGSTEERLIEQFNEFLTEIMMQDVVFDNVNDV